MQALSFYPKCGETNPLKRNDCVGVKVRTHLNNRQGKPSGKRTTSLKCLDGMTPNNSFNHARSGGIDKCSSWLVLKNKTMVYLTHEAVK